jgi:DNA-binding NarL/FixJ family response regulator
VTYVLWISEQLLFREALARALTQEEHDFSVLEASGAQDALEIIDQEKPDIVLLHLGNPAVSGGMQTLHELHEKAPDVQVIVLLDVVDDALTTVALQTGAAGCVDVSVDVSKLTQELRDAANGEIALSKGVARLITTMLASRNQGGSRHENMMLEPPTPREKEVLELMSNGLTNQAIAGRMMLSESTVRSHVRAISQKLGVQIRVQAVARALALGIIKN